MTPLDLETQCWICPKCHDDHRQDGPCSPPSGEFMPAPDDHSYIAEQYRKLRAQVEKLKQDMHLAVSDAGKDLIAERDALRAHLQEAVEALETLRADMDHHTFSCEFETNPDDCERCYIDYVLAQAKLKETK